MSDIIRKIGALSLLPIFTFSAPVKGSPLSLSSPLTGGTSVVDSSSTNNGITLEGYSDVMTDLKKYKIDMSKLEENTLLMLAENKENRNVYLYLYRKSTTFQFNRADISTVNVFNDNNEYEDIFENYALTQVSISEDMHFIKYQIKGMLVDFNVPRRRYAVRQVYNSNYDYKIEAVVPVALEFLCTTGDDGQLYTVVNSVESVLITNKDVFHALTKTNVGGTTCDKNSDCVFQDVYIAFNTAINIDDLLQVKIVSDSFYYSCLSNVGVFPTDLLNDRFYKNFNGYGSCMGREEIYENKTREISVVEPTERVSSWSGWFGFLKPRVKKWNTIQKTSEVAYINNDLKKYDWLVHFKENYFSFFSDFTPQGGTNYHAGTPTAPALQVNNASIFELTYEVNGEIKKAVAVDSYSDIIHNVPLTRDLNLFEKIINAWKGIFNNDFSITNIGYAIVSVVMVSVILILLRLLLKCFK